MGSTKSKSDIINNTDPSGAGPSGSGSSNVPNLFDRVYSLASQLNRARVNRQGSTYTIDKITNHKRKDDGTFEFEIKFKKCHLLYDVNDSDCSCESMIRNYMKSKPGLKDINTVYVYCRVSSTPQTDGYSLQSQEDKIMQFLSNQKITNQRIKIIHEKHSAFRCSPPILTEICDVAQSGDTILVYSVDRFSRDVYYGCNLVHDLSKKNVTLYSVTDNIYNSKNSHGVNDFFNRINDADRESNVRSQKIRRSIEYRRSRGIMKPTYGKKLSGDKIVNDNDAIAIINLIKRWKNMNMNFSLIAKKLNEQNKLKNGKHWNYNMVRYVFTNN